MYANGRGVAKDHVEAAKWWRLAADEDYTKAQLNLGTLYATGQGVPEDMVRAYMWFSLAAARGDLTALNYQNRVAREMTPAQIAQGNKLAADEIRKAADQGDADAQFNLGFAYYMGRRAPQDYAVAAKWFQKAADQGHTRAQYNLGVMYEEGSGVVVNYAEALRFYRLGADQGFAPAQHKLGVMYAFGHGVLQDYAEAIKWSSRADKMPSPELGGEHEAARVYHAYRWCGGVADHGAVPSSR